MRGEDAVLILMILVCFLSGTIGGMGIGGGTVLIPALTVLMDMPQKTAQLINLVYFIPTAAAALVGHVRENRVEKALLRPLIIWGCIGCVIGAAAALWLNNAVLKKMFGVFLFVMGINEMITGIKK